MDDVELKWLDRDGGSRLAYKQTGFDQSSRRAGLVWLGGFHSDMEGGKVLALHTWAREAKRSFTRFDYYGHGASDGAFADGVISRWRDDALAVLDQLTEGKQILVGSSMGGWIALLAALARPERVAGLLLIAPAPDFTETLMWARFPQAVRDEIMAEGQWMRPSEYDLEGYPITRALIEDGRENLVLEKGRIPIGVPIRVLQGMKDEDVPYAHALTLVEQLAGDDVEFTLVKGGDHRLSEPADIDRLIRTAKELCRHVDASAASPST